ncbi:XRE family transcriptional regulator [Eubacteriales bacterium OttesenSCG-928-M02]|nr:XRE family transcriptional regulator [Eubacteriales bacterium OttesenSCG-928-M02]
MQIGDKIKQLRLQRALTQEELADRAELSKGFISQLERDLTSPSINTLLDILECLGTNITDFFKEESQDKIVFSSPDIFEKENPELGNTIEWLVTTAQKNAMEPIMLTLLPSGESTLEDPHEGEEFGYVLQGIVTLCVGERQWKLKKGDSFYFSPTKPHQIKNRGSGTAKVLWVATPPSF